MFEGIEIKNMFDNNGEYAKSFVFDTPSEEAVNRAEANLGYKLPKSYVEFLKIQNGGTLADAYAGCWLTTIYGIGPNADSYNGLEDMFENWIEEWEYPNIGIPFGETQSAGHDMYFLDYRNLNKDGEPIVVSIDNECEPIEDSIYKVADSFEDFIKMVYNHDKSLYNEFEN